MTASRSSRTKSGPPATITLPRALRYGIPATLAATARLLGRFTTDDANAATVPVPTPIEPAPVPSGQRVHFEDATRKDLSSIALAAASLAAGRYRETPGVGGEDGYVTIEPIDTDDPLEPSILVARRDVGIAGAAGLSATVLGVLLAPRLRAEDEWLMRHALHCAATTIVDPALRTNALVQAPTGALGARALVRISGDLMKETAFDDAFGSAIPPIAQVVVIQPDAARPEGQVRPALHVAPLAGSLAQREAPDVMDVVRTLTTLRRLAITSATAEGGDA